MLTNKQAFDVDINGNILINEFLDSTTHESFRLTKEMAHKNANRLRNVLVVLTAILFNINYIISILRTWT